MPDGPIAAFYEASTSPDAATVAAYLKSRFPHDNNLSNFDAVASFITNNRDDLPTELIISDRDRPFFDLLTRIAERRASGAAAPRAPSVATIGPDLDFLEHTWLPNDFSALQTASFAVQAHRVPSKTVAIVLMVRDEGIYLLEWLSHYRLLGAEHIFVYTNDNADGSDQLLSALASGGWISLINNSIVQGVNPQKKAYQHAILLLDELRDYQWAMFVDADEFLTFGAENAGALPAFIKTVEQRFAGNLPGGVVFPWCWRFTDRAFSRNADGVLGHYPHGSQHHLFKSLINVRHTLSMCEVHIPTLTESDILIDGVMRQIEPSAVWNGVTLPYAGPMIEHFWSKSFVEFIIKKQRGDNLALEGKQFLREFSQFFTWTGVPTNSNYRPISRDWIAKIEAETTKMLSDASISEAYRVILERYNGFVAEACENTSLRQTYNELLRSTAPTMS